MLKSAGATNVPKKELSEFEIWQGLRTRLREMGFDPHWQGVTDPHDPQDEGFLRDITADNLAAQYPVEDETGYGRAAVPAREGGGNGKLIHEFIAFISLVASHSLIHPRVA